MLPVNRHSAFWPAALKRKESPACPHRAPVTAEIHRGSSMRWCTRVERTHYPPCSKTEKKETALPNKAANKLHSPPRSTELPRFSSATEKKTSPWQQVFC